MIPNLRCMTMRLMLKRFIMTKKVSLNELSDLLYGAISSNTESIMEACNEELERQTELLVDEVSSNAPKSNSNGVHMKDTFTKTAKTKRKRGISLASKYVVHSETRYQKFRIVHLLEDGFYNKRAKRRIEGTQFMKRALAHRRIELSNNIRKIIKEE